MRTADGGPDRGTSDGPTGLPSFAVLLRRMTSEFNRLTHEFAQAQGLHPTDVQALIAILDADHGGDSSAMTPGRLREQLDLTSGAVTACLDRLERAGHIRRVRDGGDRRVVRLHYAAAAKLVAREFFTPLAAATDAARRQFDQDELHVVVRFLKAMNDELTQLRGSTGQP